MSKKLLVNVCQPNTDISRDALIPADIRADLIIDALGAMFQNLSESRFRASKDTMLWSENLSKFLDMKLTMAENGLVNGDRLFLV